MTIVGPLTCIDCGERVKVDVIRRNQPLSLDVTPAQRPKTKVPR